MADEADRAQDIIDLEREQCIANSLKAVPAGVSGECGECGEYSARLIGNNCARCREAYRLP